MNTTCVRPIAWSCPRDDKKIRDPLFSENTATFSPGSAISSLVPFLYPWAHSWPYTWNRFNFIPLCSSVLTLTPDHPGMEQVSFQTLRVPIHTYHLLCLWLYIEYINASPSTNWSQCICFNSSRTNVSLIFNKRTLPPRLIETPLMFQFKSSKRLSKYSIFNQL